MTYKRVGLIGAIGNPNLGDEAVLETNIQKIYKMYGDDCEIYVFTKDASYTSMVLSASYSNIVVVDYLHQFTINCHYDIHVMKEKENCLFEEIKEFELQRSFLHQIFRSLDVFHIIGGGYINSLFPDMMYEVCLAIKLCKLYNVKYCFTGISVYPFDSKYTPDIEEAFSGADFVDFRDHSYKYLGLKDTSNIVQTIDDAVSLESRTIHLKSSKYATVLLHEWKENTSLMKETIKKYIVPFMKECINENVVDYFYVLGFSDGDIEIWNNELNDLDGHYEFKNCYLTGEICEAKHIIGNAVFNLGSRFHQAVFSLSSQVPVLSISYDPYYQNKLDSIHQVFDSKNVVDMNEMNSDVLNEFIHHLDEYKDSIQDSCLKVNELVSKKNTLLEKTYGHPIEKKEESSDPLISVIIPIYNMEKYLRECLDSVLNQTLKNIEIICVNDGSKDSSQAILVEYSFRDPRVKCFYHENHGVAYTRNIGIDNAKGEFLYFLDPDDIVPDENVLSDLYNAAKVNDVKVCGGSFSEMWPDRIVDHYENHYSKYTFEEDGLIEYKDYQYDFGWTRFIYDRKFLKENNLRMVELTYFEDPVFFVRVMHVAKKFYALRRHTYLYRIGHKEFKMSYKQVIDFVKGITSNLKFAKENGYEELYALEMFRLKHDYGRHILKYLSDSSSVELREELKKFNEEMGFFDNYIEYCMINTLLDN